MCLYFCKWDKRWINLTRQLVFDGYKVYELGRAPMEEDRYYTGSEYERIDILAWKKLPNIG
jgi:hypothetical protein